MFVEECKDAIVIDIVLIVAYVGDANPAVASTPSCCVTVEISASEIAPDFFAAVFLDVTQRPKNICKEDKYCHRPTYLWVS